MTKTLADISEILRDIDFAMLNTKAPDGTVAARPMSNNRQVDYDGNNYFFTLDDTLTVQHIAADPQVGLSFQGKAGIVGQRPLFVAIEGQADLVRDKGQFEAHWTTDLDRWFEQGADTPGLVLLHVRARRIHYWDGEDEGEVKI